MTDRKPFAPVSGGDIKSILNHPAFTSIPLLAARLRDYFNEIIDQDRVEYENMKKERNDFWRFYTDLKKQYEQKQRDIVKLRQFVISRTEVHDADCNDDEDCACSASLARRALD